MLTSVKPPYEYQVGGSLPSNAPTYVTRQADQDLYDSLIQGKFCYVLNSRQMGKSSLRVQTMTRLQAADVACAVIDVTSIGTQQISLEQWYASIIGILASSFQINFNLRAWWRDHSFLTPIQRLNEFFEQILLPATGQNIVIFIDEVDSVLSLKFPIDDFFALIRSFYNKRAEKPEFYRLTFALLGVATPSDLIYDKTRTPFNIGVAINLTGLQLNEAQALLPGLEGKGYPPQDILREVLYWTNGQPFLTQKLCQLISLTPPEDSQWEDSVTDWVARQIQCQVIDHWETADEPEHFKTIRDRLLRDEQRAGRLLGMYQQILLQGEIPSDGSFEQVELRLSGLVVEQDGEEKLPSLSIYNPIYAAIFNLTWTEKALSELRPYANALNAWMSSNYQDESRLLRGQTLQDAIAWSVNKSLSDQDYQFITASQTADKQQVEIMLKAEREAKQRISVILESITNAFFALDRDWQFTYVNKLCADFFQYAPEALLGKCIWEIFPQAIGSVFYINYYRVADEKIPLCFEAIGTIVETWVEVHVYPSTDGNGISVYFTDISERKHLEAERQVIEVALRESEKRYRLLFNSGPDAVFVHEYGNIRTQKFTEVNEAACQALGYTKEELLQMGPVDITPPDCPKPDSSITEQFRLYKRASFQTIHVTKDGVRFPVEIKAILFEYNHKSFVLAFARNISKRKQAEQERARAEADLQESEKRYRLLFNSGPDAVFVYEFVDIKRNQFIEVNDVACQTLGYTREELLKMCPADITPWTEPDVMIAEQLERYEQALVKSVHVTKNGSWLLVEIKAILFKCNGKDTVMAFARNISDRYQAEAALRESEARFRAIFNQAGVGISQVDVEGKFVDVNPVMSELTGYSHAELLNMSFQQITHPSDLPKDLELNRKLHTREIESFALEKRLIRKDGQIRWIHLTVSMVEDDSGKPKYNIGVLKDISDRKQLEELR